MYKTSGAEALDLFYNGDPGAFAQGVGWMTANPNSLPDAAEQMENAGDLDPATRKRSETAGSRRLSATRFTARMSNE